MLHELFELLLRICGTVSIFALLFLVANLAKGKVKLEKEKIRYLKPFAEQKEVVINEIESVDISTNSFTPPYKGFRSTALTILVKTKQNYLQLFNSQGLQIGSSEFPPTKMLISDLISHIKKYNPEVKLGEKLQEYLRNIDQSELEKLKKEQSNTLALLIIGIIACILLLCVIFITGKHV